MYGPDECNKLQITKGMQTLTNTQTHVGLNVNWSVELPDLTETKLA
jgi:hypothetical protein